LDEHTQSPCCTHGPVADRNLVGALGGDGGGTGGSGGLGGVSTKQILKPEFTTEPSDEKLNDEVVTPSGPTMPL
jgi:hypothetical protein